MWNVYTPFNGSSQKRGFCSMSSAASVGMILPEKGFSNPNLVNTFAACQKAARPSVILETIRREHPDIMRSRPIDIAATKNGRRSRRTSRSERKNKDRIGNHLDEMTMTVDMDVDEVDNVCVVADVPARSPLHIGDYIALEEVPSPICVRKGNCIAFSITPPVRSDLAAKRRIDRRDSVCESEDSFVIQFTSDGNDEEEEEEEDESDSDFEESGPEEDGEDEDTALSECESWESNVPRKKVRFAEDGRLCEVHTMVRWDFAYRKARKGPWETYALDTRRFKDKIREVESKLKPIFDQSHRERVYNERFLD